MEESKSRRSPFVFRFHTNKKKIKLTWKNDLEARDMNLTRLTFNKEDGKQDEAKSNNSHD